MAPSSRDRLSVDLHGLKAALLARAQTLGVTPSGLVRTTLAERLGQPLAPDVAAPAPTRRPTAQADRVRLCLRMPRAQARATLDAARCARLTPGDYVAGLVAGVPVLTAGGQRAEHLTALTASCAELATLSRHLHRLTALLRQADVDAARPYRAMLDTLAGDVQRHLTLAARALAELQPQRHSPRPPPAATARCHPLTKGPHHGPNP